MKRDFFKILSSFNTRIRSFMSHHFSARIINSANRKIQHGTYTSAHVIKKESSLSDVCVHIYARAQCARMKWRDWHYIRTTEMRQYWYAGVLVEGRHRLMPRHRSLSVGRFDETDTTWCAVTGFFITRCIGCVYMLFKTSIFFYWHIFLWKWINLYLKNYCRYTIALFLKSVSISW